MCGSNTKPVTNPWNLNISTSSSKVQNILIVISLFLLNFILFIFFVLFCFVKVLYFLVF